MCDKRGKDNKSKKNWKKCIPDPKKLINYDNYVPKNEDEEKESEFYKKCMINYLYDNLGDKIDEWKNIVDEKNNNELIKKKNIYEQSVKCRNKTKEFVGSKFNCSNCRISWLKNNDKLKEDVDFYYLCSKKSDYFLAIKYGKYFKCKYHDYNDNKAYYSNIMKYEDNLNPEYLCIHPEIVDRFSSDNKLNCDDNEILIKYKKIEQKIDEPKIVKKEEKQSSKIITKSPSNVPSTSKPESIFEKLLKNKKLLYIVIGVVSLLFITILISLFSSGKKNNNKSMTQIRSRRKTT